MMTTRTALLLGAKAFHKGLKRAPAMNPEFQEQLFPIDSYESLTSLYNAYAEGYDHEVDASLVHMMPEFYENHPRFPEGPPVSLLTISEEEE